MASKYSLIDHDSEEQRIEDPEGPPPVNLFAAANYLNRLFSTNGIHWAAMGGFAMICRGSRRTTHDIDVVTDATMRTLWSVIEPQPRLIIPNTKLLDGVIRVFVRTGPSYKDVGSIKDVEVEADLVIPGAKGTPVSLAQHTVTIQVTVSGHTQNLNVLDIFYMMKTKLRNCTARTMERDLEDLKFLLDNYASEIAAIRGQLDDDDIECFLAKDYMTHMGSQCVAHYRSILRG